MYEYEAGYKLSAETVRGIPPCESCDIIPKAACSDFGFSTDPATAIASLIASIEANPRKA